MADFCGESVRETRPRKLPDLLPRLRGWGPQEGTLRSRSAAGGAMMNISENSFDTDASSDNPPATPGWSHTLALGAQAAAAAQSRCDLLPS